MKAPAWLIPVSLSLPMTAWADQPPTGETPAPPPAYKVLRFDENYYYLSAATNRVDPLDAVKYIPLRPGSPDWYLSLGGEVRERFESVNDDNFGIRGGADTYWLQRLTLLTDWHFSDRVRIFAEGISGMVEGEHKPAPPRAARRPRSAIRVHGCRALSHRR